MQVLDGWSITQAQVDGKGGGEVLRQENASFGSTVKPVRKAKNFLQVCLSFVSLCLAMKVKRPDGYDFCLGQHGFLLYCVFFFESSVPKACENFFMYQVGDLFFLFFFSSVKEASDSPFCLAVLKYRFPKG